jgi:SAM-dependent methyltransferase
MLIIPDRFNKNAPGVRAMGPAADTGATLIRYMCERLGVTDLGQSDVLDFGCGSRFADAIVNRQLPVKSYVGIDVDEEMIDFLSAHVDDPRLSFLHWNARNPIYNPSGMPLNSDSALPLGDQHFDVICMFSVITHQLPPDAEAIFGLLRRHIRVGGRLFFSANIEAMDVEYREIFPESPTAHSVYSINLLRSITQRMGWHIVSIEGKGPGEVPIQDSLVCVPIEPALGHSRVTERNRARGDSFRWRHFFCR